MLQVVTMPLGAYQTNCYLLYRQGQQDCVIIDPGYEPDKILARVEALGKTVAAILLTHGHFDHVGAVRELVAETGCPVYIHEKELTMPPQMTAGPLYHTHFYDEGDILSLAGLKIRVHHTPGHTPGSVCLETEGLLLTGDTLFAGSCGRTDLPGGNWQIITASLGRLKGFDGALQVLPGHGESSVLSREVRYNPFLQG